MKVSTAVQEGLNKVYLGQLPTICLVVCGYYSIITAMHFTMLPTAILAPIAATSALVAILAVALYVQIKRSKVTPQMSHWAFLPILLSVLLTVYTHIWLSQEQHQLTNAVLFQYALGIVTLMPLLFGLLTILNIVIFAIILLQLSGEDAVHLGYMLFAAVTLSIMGFYLRYRAVYKSERLLFANRQKTRRLSVAAAEIKAKMHEVQEANAARDIFLANVTHELRTPLTGVKGMLDLMDDANLNGEQKTLIRTARKSADFLMNIINDLLDFSKLESGKLELSIEPIDVRLLTIDAVSTFQAAATAKGLELVTDIKGDMPLSLLGDNGRISQIVLNLVSNAIKFTETGSVTVTLRYSKTRGCIWTISDTGCGIPTHLQGRLFKRFEQVDASATRAKEGTGLGLTIAHELTELFQGSISVKSEVGKGAQFTLVLPLVCTDEKVRQKPNSPPHKPASTAGNENRILAQSIPSESNIEDNLSLSHLNLNVLAAEDNKVNQILIRKILTRLGIDVTMVENGSQAVEAATKKGACFDLIFMDIQMPVMDGVTAASMIIKHHDNPPPIVALTANTMPADIEQYNAIGICGIVGKPINLVELHSKILQLISE